MVEVSFVCKMMQLVLYSSDFLIKYEVGGTLLDRQLLVPGNLPSEVGDLHEPPSHSPVGEIDTSHPSRDVLP